MALLLVSMIICVAVQVVSRHLFAIPLQGTEELARLCFVWGCCLGIGYCALRHEHIAMDAISRRVSPRMASCFSLACGIALQFIAFVMIVHGSRLVAHIWTLPDLSTAMQYPRALFWLPIPLCGVILFGVGISQIVASASRLAHGQTEDASPGEGNS